MQSSVPPHEDLESAVVRIVARVTRLPEDEIRSDADLAADLGVDSLTALHVVAALEKHFGVRIPDEEIGKHRRLSEIVARIRQLLGEGGQQRAGSAGAVDEEPFEEE